MKRLLKYLPNIIYIFIVLLLIEVGYRIMMGQMNIKMPDLGNEKPEKLFTLSSIDPMEVGQKVTDTVIYTFEATDTDSWVFFDFSRGSVISNIASPREPKGWDLAFSRAKIASNGGDTSKKGQVSVAKLETTDFDSVTQVPENEKFIKNISPPSVPDTNNANLEKWYKYSFWDHYLKSHKNVFIIKTAEGNYAKMQVINFYCKKEEKRISSCYTIQYVYQGNGSKSFVKDANKSRG
ncbi:MAG: HmuY family protein [Nitrospinota bacterium]